MGAPIGNNNNKNKRPIREAFHRALELHKPADQRVALDGIVKSLIAQAMDGDIQAAKEIFDRLEGKAVQQTEVSGLDGGEIVARIERVIIDKANDKPAN